MIDWIPIFEHFSISKIINIKKSLCYVCGIIFIFLGNQEWNKAKHNESKNDKSIIIKLIINKLLLINK